MIGALGLLLALAGCQPKGAKPASGLDSIPVSGAEWTFKDLMPASVPPDPTELSLGGTHLPVKIVSTSKDGKLKMDFVAHDVVVDTETYDVQTDKFSLVAMGQELVDPPLPLVKSPMRVGDKWNWEGKITSGNPHASKAVISSRPDKLYIADKQMDAVVVEVNLAMESGGPAPAERRLTFWFVPGKGVVKREFGSGSIRQPVAKE